jgi:SAM-dependent methyltransferase
MNEEQIQLWNGTAGRAWVESQELLDRLMAPMLEIVVGAVAPGSGWRVLDIGCGTGATTLAVARRLGAGGSAVGVDISAPMIEAARARAERERSPATFICADAQTHAFEAASFDRVVSRFGVMFFDDPRLAFSNLRRAARAHAELRSLAWRGPEENPFMTTAERAAAPFVPNLPPREPDAPGQFAFSDPERVRRILDASGWGDIDLRPIDVPCAFPEGELVPYFTRFGPLGRVLHELDEPARDAIIQSVRRAFEPYVQGGQVRFTAACWQIDARALHAAQGVSPSKTR